MIIRSYRGFPRAYAPDIGEVVEARLSATRPFVPAIVTGVRRGSEGKLRCTLVWLETNMDAAVVKNRKGVVYIWTLDDRPPLIRQINKGQPLTS